MLGLTMGISGTALAAPANDGADINARIAALEAQQQQLAQQLNALKKRMPSSNRQEKSQKAIKQQSRISKMRRTASRLTVLAVWAGIMITSMAISIAMIFAAPTLTSRGNTRLMIAGI